MSYRFFTPPTVAALALAGLVLAGCGATSAAGQNSAGSSSAPASPATSAATSTTSSANPNSAVPSSGSTAALPKVYTIPGNPAGAKFEGIGADPIRGVFYVSEVTGGQIYRGQLDQSALTPWLPAGADGRSTARGITTDASGRVYIAGGPNGLEDANKPDLWVYSAEGKLLASLRAPGNKVFVNDVAIGPDGAAYFTNSNSPQIFRVGLENGSWQAKLWADGTGTISQAEGFNLGGIVLSPDRSAFVVAQGNTGQLWRFAIADGSVSAVTGGTGLIDADGLVLQGSKLTVVRNFARKVNTMELTANGRSVQPVSEVASSPDRVLTTAKELGGRILYVDSHFDDKPNGIPPYEVVTDPTS